MQRRKVSTPKNEKEIILRYRRKRIDRKLIKSAADLDVLHQYPLEDWKTIFCADHQQHIKLEILKLL